MQPPPTLCGHFSLSALCGHYLVANTFVNNMRAPTLSTLCSHFHLFKIKYCVHHHPLYMQYDGHLQSWGIYHGLFTWKVHTKYTIYNPLGYESMCSDLCHQKLFRLIAVIDSDNGLLPSVNNMLQTLLCPHYSISDRCMWTRSKKFQADMIKTKWITASFSHASNILNIREIRIHDHYFVSFIRKKSLIAEFIILN